MLVDQLAGLAARRPVLVLFEDVHWIDPTTLELFDLVVERSAQLPVLLLITFRPEFLPPWAGHAHVTAMSSAGLAGAGGGVWSARVAGEAAASDLVEQIVAQDGRRAAVCRGADQDGPGIGSARGRPLRAGRAAAAARDSDDTARLADGAPRPPGPRQGGRADRRGDRTRVLLRAAGGGRAVTAAEARRPPSTSWSAPSSCSVAARRPIRSTPSSTHWCRTPPTNRCSGPRPSAAALPDRRRARTGFSGRRA